MAEKGCERRLSTAIRLLAVVGRDDQARIMGALRPVRNYGLRSQDFLLRPVPRVRRPPAPSAKAASTPALAPLRFPERPATGAAGADIRKSRQSQGATATMLVFKRSAALAIMVCALLAGARAAWPGSGSLRPGRSECSSRPRR